MSLVFSVALVVTLLVLAVLAGAPDNVISDARAQYASDGQYGAAPQYDAADGSAQPGVAPSNDQSGVAPSCEQKALNALNSPALGSNSAQDNRKLLAQFVKCGGTIASLPQATFRSLVMQGDIELDIAGSGSFACPRGDKSHCSAVSGI